MPRRLPDLSGLAHPCYRNPFHRATVQVGRVDMGVDYHGTGPICAIGRCKIVGIDGSGWPDRVYILMRLLRGRHRGKLVYYAEALRPLHPAGVTVRKGKPVAELTADAGLGRTGIEIGWGSPIVNLTLAAETEAPLPPDNANTRAGQAFARFLRRIGAPAPDTGHGREYP